MKLLLRAKHVYGVRQLYPVNDAAVGLALIAGTKTLTPSVLETAVRYLGATVELVQETLNTSGE